MKNPPTKSQLIESIQNDYRAWKDTLAQLNDMKMVQVKIGEWTVKDIIAHITWHENEMVGMLKAHALVGSPWWELPTEKRNQLIFEQNQDRGLGNIRQEADRVHARLVQLLEALPEGDLYNPAGFPNMPSDWQPCDLIIQNTYEHYRDHTRDIQACSNEHNNL